MRVLLPPQRSLSLKTPERGAVARPEKPALPSPPIPSSPAKSAYTLPRALEDDHDLIPIMLLLQHPHHQPLGNCAAWTSPRSHPRSFSSPLILLTHRRRPPTTAPLAAAAAAAAATSSSSSSSFSRRILSCVAVRRRQQQRRRRPAALPAAAAAGSSSSSRVSVVEYLLLITAARPDADPDELHEALETVWSLQYMVPGAGVICASAGRVLIGGGAGRGAVS